MKTERNDFWHSLRRMWLVSILGPAFILFGAIVSFSSTNYMTSPSDPDTLLSTWMSGVIVLGVGLAFIVIGVGLLRLYRKAMYGAVVLSFLFGFGFWALVKMFGGTAPSSPSWEDAIGSLIVALPFLVGIMLMFHIRYRVEQGGRLSLRAKILFAAICVVFAIMPFAYEGYRYVADRTNHSLGSDFIFAERHAAMSMDLNLQEFTYATDLSPDDFLAKYPKIGTREDATTIYFDDAEVSGMHANFCTLSDGKCRHKLDAMHPFNKAVYDKKYLVTFDSDFAYQKMAETVGVDVTGDY